MYLTYNNKEIWQLNETIDSKLYNGWKRKELVEQQQAEKQNCKKLNL